MLAFTYFIKGMANISGDVIINFWLEREGTAVSSGQDTIYLGSFEEKTESTHINIPRSLETGSYQFYVRVSYENYNATSYRTVYVEQGEELKVVLEEPKIQEPASKPHFVLAGLIILSAFLFIGLMYWKNRRTKEKIRQFLEKVLPETKEIPKSDSLGATIPDIQKIEADHAETENITIKQSEIEGKGVFAARDFEKGERVLDLHDSLSLTSAQAKKVPEEYKQYIYYGSNKQVLVQPPARFVNHSCDPNTGIRNLYGIARRDIKKNEEITKDYSKEKYPGLNMECNCGSENCNGIITAKKRNKKIKRKL